MLRVVRRDDRRPWGIVAGRVRRWIDPNRRRQGFDARRPLHEAFGVRDVGGQARAVTDLEDRRGAAVVDVGRRDILISAINR